MSWPRKSWATIILGNFHIFCISCHVISTPKKPCIILSGCQIQLKIAS
jgi:hypothetical protein